MSGIIVKGEKAMASLSVVIPAYNEEDGIAAIVERVLAVRPSLRACGVQELEVIVVDDDSQDRTGEIVACNPDVRLVKHEVNRVMAPIRRSASPSSVSPFWRRELI
jgi:cellulose synthase/poly-beta-1,6-N-acetylglucosamine synthase-like glycosyltransferase